LNGEKELTSHLNEELHTTEQKIQETTMRLQEVEERLSSQEINIESLEDALQKKDEVGLLARCSVSVYFTTSQSFAKYYIRFNEN